MVAFYPICSRHFCDSVANELEAWSEDRVTPCRFPKWTGLKMTSPMEPRNIYDLSFEQSRGVKQKIHSIPATSQVKNNPHPIPSCWLVGITIPIMGHVLTIHNTPNRTNQYSYVTWPLGYFFSRLKHVTCRLGLLVSHRHRITAQDTPGPRMARRVRVTLEPILTLLEVVEIRGLKYFWVGLAATCRRKVRMKIKMSAQIEWESFFFGPKDVHIASIKFKQTRQNLTTFVFQSFHRALYHEYLASWGTWQCPQQHQQQHQHWSPP